MRNIKRKKAAPQIRNVVISPMVSNICLRTRSMYTCIIHLNTQDTIITFCLRPTIFWHCYIDTNWLDFSLLQSQSWINICFEGELYVFSILGLHSAVNTHRKYIWEGWRWYTDEMTWWTDSTVIILLLLKLEEKNYDH